MCRSIRALTCGWVYESAACRLQRRSTNVRTERYLALSKHLHNVASHTRAEARARVRARMSCTRGDVLAQNSVHVIRTRRAGVGGGAGGRCAAGSLSYHSFNLLLCLLEKRRHLRVKCLTHSSLWHPADPAEASGRPTRAPARRGAARRNDDTAAIFRDQRRFILACCLTKWSATNVLPNPRRT